MRISYPENFRLSPTKEERALISENEYYNRESSSIYSADPFKIKGYRVEETSSDQTATIDDDNVFHSARIDQLNINFSDRQFSLNPNLKEVYDEIEYSKSILDLKKDWNNQNGEPISKPLYFSAIEFLVNYSNLLAAKNIIISAPEINPCNDGTIDLSWRTLKHRLLINFRISNQEFLGIFYRDEYNNKNSNKGNLVLPNIDESFLVWMKNLKL
ncbi:hypothetical protein A0256_13705 [Mucilaginibacter sp. PAMC 26640]|nr:hypothetical protein A0256_13705 [Mucilaginibacter sp. PAMC 26640]